MQTLFGETISRSCTVLKIKSCNSKPDRPLTTAQRCCQTQHTLLLSCGSKTDVLNESYNRISLLIAEIDNMCLEQTLFT